MRRATILPLAVAAAVGLAACGSGGDAPDGTTSTSTSTSTSAAPSATSTTTTPATVPGGTRVTGSGYAFSLPGSGWSDRRAALPAAQRRSYDRVFSQGMPGGGQPVVQTTRVPVPPSERNRPQALARFEAGFREGATENGGEVGRAATTTLDGDGATVVPATGRTDTGRTFYSRTVLTVHDGSGTGVTVIGRSDDRATVDRIVGSLQRTWRWTP